MSIVLMVLACLAFVGGFGTLIAAKSAVHEIEAYVLFLIFAVFLSGAAIVDAVKAAAKSKATST